MASSIVLSAGVRQNLLALQNTSSLMALTQNRLATGRRVNSALDNPSNFFTSAALSARANDLNALLDAIGQAQKTLEAADQGISSLVKLVESAKSIAKQARTIAAPTSTYALTATGSNIPADTAPTTTSTNTFASAIGAATPSNFASLVIDATDIPGDLADGDTFSITYNGVTTTFESDKAGDGVTSGNVAITNDTDFTTALQSVFGAGNVNNTGGTITITGSDYTNNFTVGGTAAAQATSNTSATNGDVLTINDGTSTATFRYVASGANAANGTFTTLSDLNAALAASSVSGVTAADDGSGHLQLSSTASFTAGGTLQASLGLPATAVTTSNATLAALNGKSLTLQVGTGATNTFNFTATTTRADLSAWLAGLNLGTGITAAINSAGAVEITSTSDQNITFGGTAAADLGLDGGTAGVYSPTVTTTSTDASRANYQSQYNEILSQIDALTKDTVYNGVNLLSGDQLKVVFNERGTSSLTIQGVTFDSAGLGLSQISGNGFQVNANIDDALAAIDTALTTLRTQASNFGSTLTTVQTRQDFIKNLTTILTTGSDELVLADTNEEGANMLALQTRQQLSTTALSLSAQADQAVLKLFG